MISEPRQSEPISADLETAEPQRRTVGKRRLRRLVEFKGFHRFTLGQYRSSIRNLYDGPAGAVLAVGSLLSLHEPLVGHMLRRRRFDVTRFGRVLDVGSGAGQILGHLIRATDPNSQIVAFDLSSRMLHRARSRVRSDRPNYVSGDLMQLPFADGSFDCVTCGYVLEHLPDPVPGLKEVERILAPGGSVLVLATEDTLSGAVVSRTWKCRTYNRIELEQACCAAGLPWHEQLWFTRVHRFFKMGGILVEARKPVGV